MSAPNVIVLSPVVIGNVSQVGAFYDIAGEFPNDPFKQWLLWLNYPWMFPGGVNRIQLGLYDPVQE